MPKKKANEGQRVELNGPLAGSWVELDPDKLTIRLLRDVQSGQVAQVVEAISGCLVDGELPHGADVEGVLDLTGPQFQSLAEAIAGPTRSQIAAKGVREVGPGHGSGAGPGTRRDVPCRADLPGVPCIQVSRTPPPAGGRTYADDAVDGRGSQGAGMISARNVTVGLICCGGANPSWRHDHGR